MSAQAIHILALLALIPATAASLVWACLALRFRGGFGVTWRSVALSCGTALIATSALIYVAYHPQALPTLFSHVVLPPNPFRVT